MHDAATSRIRATGGGVFGLLLAGALMLTGCDDAGSTAGGPKPPKPPKPPAPPAAAPVLERVPAKAGVGKQGRSLANETGIRGVIVQPARTLFSVKQRVVFDIQIPHQLQLYKALNGAPKTHQEFMTNVIEAYKIQLPELPAGHRYIYDPKKEELQVERPRTSGDK